MKKESASTSPFLPYYFIVLYANVSACPAISRLTCHRANCGIIPLLKLQAAGCQLPMPSSVTLHAARLDTRMRDFKDPAHLVSIAYVAGLINRRHVRAG